MQLETFEHMKSDPEGIFGIDIDLCAGVLRQVDAALQWLNENHLMNEGLWRVSGSRTEVKRLRAVVDERGGFPLDEIEKSELMTGLLVLFLQRLPGGLIDIETTAIVLNGEYTAENVMQIIVTRISTNKFQLLNMFLDHWRRVVLTPENKLNANGIATCVFGVVFPGIMDMRLIPIVENLLKTQATKVDMNESNSGPGWQTMNGALREQPTINVDDPENRLREEDSIFGTSSPEQKAKPHVGMAEPGPDTRKPSAANQGGKPAGSATSTPSLGPISDPADNSELLAELAAYRDAPETFYNPQIGAALDGIALNDLEAFKEAMLTIHPGEMVFDSGEAAVRVRDRLNLPNPDAPAMTLVSLAR